MFGVVGEDDLVEGGGAFFVCQTHQQFLPLDARSAVVVADEFGYVKGIISIPPEHIVHCQVSGLYRNTITAVYIIFQYIVFVCDVKAYIFR